MVDNNENIAETLNASVRNRSGDILHRLIEHEYHNIQRFADAIGYSRSMISQIIHGHIPPSNEQKMRIAKKLKVDSRFIWRD